MKKGQPLFSELQYCTRCCMPETHRNAYYDEFGCCRGCQSSEQKMHINWAEREKQLRQILSEARKKAGNNYDCLLPLSGGKDSMFQAHVLVKIYKMKPLAVTHNHNWYSETGWYNLTNLLETFNIDHIMFTPNRDLVNRLAKRSLETIGDACWHCHSGAGAFPHQIAVRFNIPLIVYGESVAESHGRASYYEPVKHELDYFTKVSAGFTPDQMVCDYVSPKDIYPYQLPDKTEWKETGVMAIHLGDFIFWDHERQTEFVRDTYGWRETDIENSYKHYKSAECIMPGVHDFTCYLKRGYCRATTEGTFDVRHGLLNREEALRLIAEVDPIEPEVLKYYLEITGMTKDEFYETMKQHREPQVKDIDLPVLKKDKSHTERLLPFPLQILERLKRKEAPIYVTDKVVNGKFTENNNIRSNEFARMSAGEIASGYLTKKFSPVEIAKACIERIESINNKVNAFEYFDPEILLRDAKQIENRLMAQKPVRLLEGVPIGVKDIYNTTDYPTQMGSQLWKGFTPGNDARAVFNIKRAGGIVAGKTVTAEFAVHAPNGTLNPYDFSRTPGTSSSGSAVSVTLGMTSVALASQTAGSISRPASFCGVFGYKPTFGLIPRTGTLKTTDSLDTLGFIFSHLDDVVRVFNSIRVYGHNYPISNQKLGNEFSNEDKKARKKWRVALIKTYTWHNAYEYTQNALMNWLKKLDREEADIEIVEVDLPEDMCKIHDIHATIYNSSLAYYFMNESGFEDKVSPVMLKMIERGKLISPQEYKQALGIQEKLILKMDQILEGFDVGISLSTAGVAPKRDDVERPDPSLIWTFMQLPVLCLPLFKSQTGLPFGTQLFAQKYSDFRLLDFASSLHEKGFIPGSSEFIFQERLGIDK